MGNGVLWIVEEYAGSGAWHMCFDTTPSTSRRIAVTAKRLIQASYPRWKFRIRKYVRAEVDHA
jgi:hypothetical protein